MNKLPNFSYQIVKDYGEISNTGNQAKRLRAISYNGHPAKFDLRVWIRDREDPSREILGKGITLSTEEMIFLKEILSGIDLDEDAPIPNDKGFGTGGGFTAGTFG